MDPSHQCLQHSRCSVRSLHWLNNSSPTCPGYRWGNRGTGLGGGDTLTLFPLHQLLQGNRTGLASASGTSLQGRQMANWEDNPSVQNAVKEIKRTRSQEVA